jgi:hyperosmotically inducible periplasmic protein
MKSGNSLRVSFLRMALLGLIAVPSCFAAQQPDNSGANKGQRTTADQQKNNNPDRDMAKKIRQSIVEDQTLSTHGHNVKVIVNNGEVTLKGPVKNQDEKTEIESKATAIAGMGKVRNELSVKGEQ